MNAIQPSFYQWRKKINAALAMDASRVTLMFTSPHGQTFSIEPEELQSPQTGTYTAKIKDGSGGEQEVSSDFDIAPERPIRRAPEDAFIARYERMADDLERARQVSEARARAIEVEKMAGDEKIAAQQRRIRELEQRVEELEQQKDEGLFDEDTAALILQVVETWTGAAEIRLQVGDLLDAIERDPRTAERIAQRVPQAIAVLAAAMNETER